MPEAVKITVTIMLDMVIEDEEHLDSVCEDLHEQIGVLMVGNDWTGTVELSCPATRHSPHM